MDSLPELLAATARGEDSAWRRLIELYGRRVFAMAKAHCRRDELAEEITQSVFVTIAEKIGKGQYTEQGRFEAWLFRVTMNRVRDEVRRTGRQAGSVDPSVLSDFAGSSGRTEDVDEERHAEMNLLRLALNELGTSDREVIDLRHHAGLSFQTIADLLGEPLGTILARHHRALRKIRQFMESRSDSGEPARGGKES